MTMKQPKGTTKEVTQLQNKLSKAYSSALIYVTMRCNLRCPRCFLGDLPADKRAYDMTREQFAKIIDRLAEQNRLPLRFLYLTGGEPTLWPHLKWAIQLCKERGVAQTIRVGTNAVDRNAEDYGEADLVIASHYGAINRADIARLRRQMGRRLKIMYVVHLPWPFKDVPADNVPADCGCVNMAFVGDRVYPCGMGAARGGESLPVGEQFYYRFVNGNPYTQDLCRSCLSNRKNKVPHMSNLTCEFGVWDSPLAVWLTVPTKAMGLRAIYRRLFPK